MLKSRSLRQPDIAKVAGASCMSPNGLLLQGRATLNRATNAHGRGWMIGTFVRQAEDGPAARAPLLSMPFALQSLLGPTSGLLHAPSTSNFSA